MDENKMHFINFENLDSLSKIIWAVLEGSGTF
jgi:hypothetical protein